MISKKFTGKQELMLLSLKTFFEDTNMIGKMIPIVEGDANISLRLLEWFVTNYSKKHNTFYSQYSEQDNRISHFFVYLNYKLQLKAYSKKQFDPFCRRDRIKFHYSEDNFIITTIGQLNFFRWAINHGVIEYVENNRSIIEKDMNKAIKLAYGNKQESLSPTNSLSSSISPMSLTTTTPTTTTTSTSTSSTSSRKPRRELSESATKKVNKTNVKVVISFD